MTRSKATLIGFAAIAAATTVVGIAPHPRAATPQAVAIGPWQIAAASDSIAWKLNTVTGELLYCSGISCEPARTISD